MFSPLFMTRARHAAVIVFHLSASHFPMRFHMQKRYIVLQSQEHIY